MKDARGEVVVSREHASLLPWDEDRHDAGTPINQPELPHARASVRLALLRPASVQLSTGRSRRSSRRAPGCRRSEARNPDSSRRPSRPRGSTPRTGGDGRQWRRSRRGPRRRIHHDPPRDELLVVGRKGPLGPLAPSAPSSSGFLVALLHFLGDELVVLLLRLLFGVVLLHRLGARRADAPVTRREERAIELDLPELVG